MLETLIVYRCQALKDRVGAICENMESFGDVGAIGVRWGWGHLWRVKWGGNLLGQKRCLWQLHMFG